MYGDLHTSMCRRSSSRVSHIHTAKMHAHRLLLVTPQLMAAAGRSTEAKEALVMDFKADLEFADSFGHLQVSYRLICMCGVVCMCACLSSV